MLIVPRRGPRRPVRSPLAARLPRPYAGSHDMTDIDPELIDRIVTHGGVDDLAEANRMELWAALARLVGSDVDLEELRERDRIPKSQLVVVTQREAVAGEDVAEVADEV